MSGTWLRGGGRLVNFRSIDYPFDASAHGPEKVSRNTFIRDL
jgi:hypothetical protein